MLSKPGSGPETPDPIRPAPTTPAGESVSQVRMEVNGRLVVQHGVTLRPVNDDGVRFFVNGVRVV